jgi:hypothetical protein
MGTKGWHAICSTMLLNQIKTIHVQPKRHSMKITQQPVAIVTGASSGIGLGITQAPLERGWPRRGYLSHDQQVEGPQAFA